MTMREVSFCLKRINEREEVDYSSRAALHGIKIPVKTRANAEEAVEIDDKTREKTSSLMKQAIERRKREGK